MLPAQSLNIGQKTDRKSTLRPNTPESTHGSGANLQLLLSKTPRKGLASDWGGVEEEW